jgi:hypothetical protein
MMAIATIVAARGQTMLEATPDLYGVHWANHELPQIEWIIEGTDNILYVVPAEPGGWLRRSEYQGQMEKLKAVSQEEARSICWMMYGDVGRVTMKGENLESS